LRKSPAMTPRLILFERRGSSCLPNGQYAPVMGFVMLIVDSESSRDKSIRPIVAHDAQGKSG
jgi:hypothetical protein